jgi:predicted transcriptional regulator of viral defense system
MPSSARRVSRGAAWDGNPRSRHLTGEPRGKVAPQVGPHPILSGRPTSGDIGLEADCPLPFFHFTRFDATINKFSAISEFLSVFLPQFFAQHPVFRVSEIKAYMESHSSVNDATRNASLAYHLRRGHIIRVRRGLYASIPTGVEAQSHRVDPVHVTARATEDAVLGYGSALAVHLSQPPRRGSMIYLTGMSLGRPFEFQGRMFRGTMHPRPLRDSGDEGMGITVVAHNGMPIRLTSLERTVVDILDRPILTGRWETIWALLTPVSALDPDKVLEYTLALENATTAAKVGFYLSQRRRALEVGFDILAQLQENRPTSPHYMDRLYASEGRLIQDWNLIVPRELVDRH